MKIFRTYSDLPENIKNSVVVIGNFDGVHKAHRTLLDTAHEQAKKLNTHVCVLTFEPHPRVLFRPDDPPFRIASEDMKFSLLSKQNVTATIVLDFNWDLASMSAETFVTDILVQGLKACHVVIGYDFKFGQLRKGSADTIKNFGLPVTVVDEVKGASSTMVRQALQHGKIKTANDILGWSWEIQGIVEHGDGRGKDFGYPTANFKLNDIVHPRYGVYAAYVQINDENAWHGAAINIGIRPMFKVHEAQVESFIFDFNRNIYGQKIRVRPVEFLRGEAKFDSLDGLIKQIDQDCQSVQQILSAHPIEN